MFGAMHGGNSGVINLRGQGLILRGRGETGGGGFKNNIQLKKNVLNSVYYHKSTYI